MDIDYQTRELAGPDPLRAMERLGKAPPSLARGAISALIRLIKNPQRPVAIQALLLALDIGPDHEADFSALLRHLLEEKPRGYLVPRMVSLLEHHGPRYVNSIELIAKALEFPHFRIRLAAIRALDGMAVLFELIEPGILKALKDQSISVRQAMQASLHDNFDQLTPFLQKTVQDYTPEGFNEDQRREAQALEQFLWRPRALALNSNGADGDDVIFALHKIPRRERRYDLPEQIDDMARGHGLPDISKYLGEITHEDLPEILEQMLTPLNDNCLYAPPDIQKLATRLLNFFNTNARLFSLKSEHIVCSGIQEQGLVIMDETSLCIFWVADMD